MTNWKRFWLQNNFPPVRTMGSVKRTILRIWQSQTLPHPTPLTICRSNDLSPRCCADFLNSYFKDSVFADYSSQLFLIFFNQMIWWSIHKFDHSWSKCSDIKHLVSPTQQCLKHILKMKTTTRAGLLVKLCRRNGVKASSSLPWFASMI